MGKEIQDFEVVRSDDLRSFRREVRRLTSGYKAKDINIEIIEDGDTSTAYITYYK